MFIYLFCNVICCGQLTFSRLIHLLYNNKTKGAITQAYVALSCIQKGVTFSSIKIFNALPQSLVELKTEKLRFKSALRRFLKYHSFYILEELFSSNSNIIL
jgi:hypothetical protein